nr:MAG TPA: hypothetical protein [Bacteriophage sp.]
MHHSRLGVLLKGMMKLMDMMRKKLLDIYY